MTLLPPVSGINVGQSTGGGLLDTFKNAMAGATGGSVGQTPGQTPAQTDPGPKGDGSVGLFDGVLKKALFGGAAGVAMGFIPFLPGGPVLGGIVGALGGAAMGMFSNWTKMKRIQQENQATLAAMGVQTGNPEIQQVLQTGNVSQLIPMMQEAQQGEGAGSYQVTQDQLVAQQSAIQQGQVPSVVDPGASGIYQSSRPTQGKVTVGAGVGSGVNPSLAVDPGVAPANLGGGAAGDAGRPAAPVGTDSADVSKIAPDQAGIDVNSISDAQEGVGLVTADEASMTQLSVMIKQLQQQIDMLKAMIEADQERHAAQLEAEASEAEAKAS